MVLDVETTLTGSVNHLAELDGDLFVASTTGLCLVDSVGGSSDLTLGSTISSLVALDAATGEVVPWEAGEVSASEVRSMVVSGTQLAVGTQSGGLYFVDRP